ncbi:MAG: hypothetical protein QOJ89_2168 [bacterium]
MAKASNGDLLVVYRAAVDHATTNGVIEQRRSTDDGATWGAATTIATIAGQDARDPAIANTPYGLLLTYCEYDLVSSFPRLYCDRSLDDGTTWSNLAIVDDAYSENLATSAPVVVAADGSLLWPTHGADIGDTLARLRVLKSCDGGQTWTVAATLVDATREWVEPNITLLSGGDLLMMIRSDTGTPGIYSSRSTDDGATWTAPTLAWAASGRPAVLELWGTVWCAYRANGSLRTKYRTSTDDGVSWSTEGDFSPTRAVYTYAQWCDRGGLIPAIAWAEETSISNSAVFFSRVPA